VALREEFNRYVDDQKIGQDELDALTLTEVSTELEIVLNNQERFIIENNHPLRTVTPGTAGDDAGQIGGCWGRIEIEYPITAFGGEAFPRLVAESMRVDLRPGLNPTIIIDRMEGIGGIACVRDDRPIITTLFYSITAVESSHFALLLENGLAAGLNDDGSLSLHELATFQTAVEIGQARTLAFTVIEDALATGQRNFDASAPLNDRVDLWVRFDCVR